MWVYQRTGSATLFALISLATVLPGILFSPFAGALVDRWDRRWAMILSDSGAALCTLTVALLLSLNRLEVWHIYALMAISSTFSAFQWPAYSAATTMLVPQEQLGRASGMVQLGQAFAQIASPVLAGALMGVIHVYGVIFIDFATFLVALTTLLAVRIPHPKTTAEGEAGRGSLLHEAAFGWHYILARRGLLALLLFFAANNFAIGIVGVLFTPLVLGFTTAAVLGAILSTGGLGFLAGSLVMSAWGGPKVRVRGIYAFALMQGLVLFLAGFPPQAWILGLAAGLFFFCLPIINGCSQAIWQVKTAADVQGRVFAVRRMIAWSTTPLAYLVAGPLADHIFEPLMAEGGPLADLLGSIIGVGPGRGIALLYLVLGTALLGVVAVAFLYRPMRRVEAELPDIVVEEEEKAALATAY